MKKAVIFGILLIIGLLGGLFIFNHSKKQAASKSDLVSQPAMKQTAAAAI